MVLQPYHLVDQSPWPLLGSISGFLVGGGMVMWFHGYSMIGLFIGLTITLLTMIQWWRDIIRESTFRGYHTSYVMANLRSGMVLFILSEVMFFFGFFWAFFHSSLAPTPEIACSWPPNHVTPIPPFSVPLLNTAVLLASGVSVTWAHHSIMEGNRSDGLQSLSLTVLLGIYFTILQIGEYHEATFTIADSVFGATFFMATGFHGFHVIIGTSFLTICLLRLYAHHYSPSRHFGFEAAAWYWHFVDVVWIFLYLSLYWWGS